jgi:Flp pilus assembly protein TadG
VARLVRAFAADRSAGLTAAFGLALGGMVVAAGAALDYSNASTQRYRLQSIADAAAMAGAREFRLGNASEHVIRDSVANHARAALGELANSITIVTSADTVTKSATATLSTKVSTYIMHIAGNKLTDIKATATAKMTGGAPICVVGLEEMIGTTIELTKSAKLSAPNCAVYSNGKLPNSLLAMNSATMVANFICSAGGKLAAGPGSFSPSPRTDCPILPDPLRSRPLPTPDACKATNLVVKGTMLNLTPGTYCGGLTVDVGAIVSLASGTYIFKGGPLVVKDGGSLTGVNVSLFFSGVGASMRFESATTISLTAPKSSDMAGILIAEDRKNPVGQQFEIYSNNARNLLGTIYLPQGRLFVAANNPVSDQSAYTIVVARRFSLSEGPTMVLNTNYGATDIPVPNGVGPNISTQLTN